MSTEKYSSACRLRVHADRLGDAGEAAQVGAERYHSARSSSALKSRAARGADDVGDRGDTRARAPVDRVLRAPRRGRPASTRGASVQAPRFHAPTSSSRAPACADRRLRPRCRARALASSSAVTAPPEWRGVGSLSGAGRLEAAPPAHDVEQHEVGERPATSAMAALASCTTCLHPSWTTIRARKAAMSTSRRHDPGTGLHGASRPPPPVHS